MEIIPLGTLRGPPRFISEVLFLYMLLFGEWGRKRKSTETPPGNGAEARTLPFRKFCLCPLPLPHTQAANKMKDNGAVRFFSEGLSDRLYL